MSLEETPLNESQNANENVNLDAVTTPSRHTREPTIARTTVENGVQNVDVTETTFGSMSKEVPPSKSFTGSQIVSLDYSNKKRRQSDLLIEVPTSNDTSSKKKKQTAFKSINPTRIQDPAFVTHQQQLQEQHPPMILCQTTDPPNEDGNRPIRTVRVTEKLWRPLKQHQIDGVRFMWRNCFADFAYYNNGNTAHCGGCILAHNMGLVCAHWFPCRETVLGYRTYIFDLVFVSGEISINNCFTSHSDDHKPTINPDSTAGCASKYNSELG